MTIWAGFFFSAGVDGLSYPSPALPTDSNFVSLFKQFTSYIFGLEKVNQASSVNLQTSGGYQVSLCLKGVTAYSSCSISKCTFVHIESVSDFFIVR